MADHITVRISELPGADALTGVELVPLVQAGTTKIKTVQDIVQEGGLAAHEIASDPHDQYAFRVINNLVATTNPAVSNDSTEGYEVLSRWVNVSTAEIFLCLNASVGAAEWQEATLTIDDLGSAALANVGAGNGLDADLLDGLQGADYWTELKQANDKLREDLLKQATLSLDFSNNKYEVYEGPVNSLTQMPFNDVLDFTRGSSAIAQTATRSYVTVLADQQRLVGNREGLLIEEARTNLLSYPRQFDNAVWGKTGLVVTPNALTSPDGTLTASKLISDDDDDGTTNYIIQSVGEFLDNTVITAYVYAKKGELNTIRVAVRDKVGGYRGVNFNLETLESIVDIGVISSMEPCDNGWFKVSVTVDIGGGSEHARAVYYPRNDGTLSGFNGTNGIYIWHAQLEEGSFPTSIIPDGTTFTSRASTATYLDSTGTLQTAGVDVARDDAYGYVDGVLKPIGLLLEGAGTNLTSDSENFVSWNTNGTTLSANVINGPFDSSLRASEVFPTTESTEHQIEYILSSLSSAEYTQSIHVKASGTATGFLRVIHVGESEAYSSISFDLSNETIDATNNRVTKTSIEKLKNGWFRLSVTYSLTSATKHRQRILPRGSGAYSGDTTSSLYIWGAQTEEGSSPSSYIPTQGTQVTRAADVSASPQVTRAADLCKRVLTGNEFEQNQGTIYAEFSTKEDQAGIGLTDDTVLERVVIRRSGVGIGQALLSSDGVTNTIDTDAGVYVDEGFNKLAVSWTPAGYKFACNGQIIGSNSLPSGRVPLFTNLIIAISQNLGIRSKVRVNKSCRLFPKALSEAELITLTVGN